MANRKSGPTRPPVLDLDARKKQVAAEDAAPEGDNSPERIAAPETAADPSGGAETPAEAQEHRDANPDTTELPAGPPAHSQETLTEQSRPGEAADEATPETRGDATHDPVAESAAGTLPPHAAAPSPPQRPHGTAAGRGARTGIAIVGGAALGLGLAYGLASFGLWPGAEDTSNTDARLAALETQAGQVDQSGDGEALAAVAALTDRLEALEAAPAPQGGAAPQELTEDLAALAETVADLDQRLAALAAAPPGDAAGADGAALEAVAGLDGALTTLQTELGDIAGQAATRDERIAALEQALADQPAIAEIAADRDRFAQWPSALAALRGRIDAGESFDAELDAVTVLAPELPVPTGIDAGAANGVVTAEALASQFSARIPAMLRARPGDPDAPWHQRLLAQASAALALRPAGEITGEGPDADLARAEAALEAGDLDAALAAIEALPQEMRDAAGSVVDAIAERAATDIFIRSAENFGPASDASSEDPQE